MNFLRSVLYCFVFLVSFWDFLESFSLFLSFSFSLNYLIFRTLKIALLHYRTNVL